MRGGRRFVAGVEIDGLVYFWVEPLGDYLLIADLLIVLLLADPPSDVLEGSADYPHPQPVPVFPPRLPGYLEN